MSAPAEVVSLKRTPLYPLHRELGAKLIDFGGWEMPVQYQGILEEHRAVRERAGIFDVSHMGELEVTGPESLEALQRLTPNDVEKVFRGVLEAGKPDRVVPCGLGARDTLRLEAKMALYGNDIDDTVTPWEADLGSAVGTEFSVDIRGRQARARVVETPFYKRKKEVPA